MSQPAGHIISDTIGAVHGVYIIDDRLMGGYIEYPENQQQPCIIMSLPTDADEMTRRRFAHEAMIGLEVTRDHENLLTTLQFGEWADRQLFIAFEHIRGHTVYEKLADLQGDYGMVRSILRSVVGALDHLHKRGVAHGWVAAENLLIGADGIIRLGNLGRAKRPCEPNDKVNDLRALGTLLFGLCYGDAVLTVPDECYAEHIPLDVPGELVLAIALLIAEGANTALPSDEL